MSNLQPLVYYESVVTLPEELCAVCRKIDFDIILSAAQGRAGIRYFLSRMMPITLDLDISNPHMDIAILDLEKTFHELQTSNCPLCRLLGSTAHDDGTVGRDSEDSLPGECQLWKFWARYSFEVLLLLTVVEMPSKTLPTSFEQVIQPTFHDQLRQSFATRKFLGIHNPHMDTADGGLRPIDPINIDVKFITDCLAECRNGHGKCRQSSPSLEPNDYCQPSKSPAVNLRVIDCPSRSVIAAPPSCRYVALSYLWSDFASDLAENRSGFQGDILYHLPKLIESAIELTLQLGLRFLWCDRYCIDQSNQEVLASQIRQMDAVYTNSELTVIAAANVDGLPGVGGLPRTKQLGINLNGTSIVSAFADPRPVINASTWNSRGWTFQEALLSRRRLFVYQDQAVYECEKIYREESMYCAREPSGWSHNCDYFYNYSREGILQRPVPASNVIRTAENVRKYIEQFYMRKLTYPSDTLRAIDGIFSAYRSLREPVHNYWGLVFQFELTYYQDFTAKDQFIAGLQWSLSQSGTRNRFFPSWSWAGWTGGCLRYRCMHPGYYVYRFTTPIWHMDAGNLIPLPNEDLVLSYTAGKYTSPYIYLKGKSFSATLTKDEVAPESSFNDSLYHVYLTNETAEVFGRVPALLDGGIEESLYTKLLAVPLEREYPPSQTEQDRTDPGPGALILVEKSGHYERVGIIPAILCDDLEIIDREHSKEEIVHWKNVGYVEWARRGNNWWEQMLESAPMKTFCIG